LYYELGMKKNSNQKHRSQGHQAKFFLNFKFYDFHTFYNFN